MTLWEILLKQIIISLQLKNFKTKTTRNDYLASMLSSEGSGKPQETLEGHFQFLVAMLLAVRARDIVLAVRTGFEISVKLKNVRPADPYPHPTPYDSSLEFKNNGN